MAVLAAAQLLDELMGRHRNTNPNEKIKKPNWEDSEVRKLQYNLNSSVVRLRFNIIKYKMHFNLVLFH